MNAANEIIVTKSFPSIGRLQPLSSFLEGLQILAKIKTGDVHNDVEEGNSGTSVVGGLHSSQSRKTRWAKTSPYLVCKPNVLGTFLSIFECLGVVIMIPEQENHSVNWFAARNGQLEGVRNERQTHGTKDMHSSSSPKTS